jgi:hyaluronan synthase
VNLLRYIYLPLGALGLVRWLSWLVHRIPAAFYRPITTGYRASLAVVTPVYQEDPDIFRLAIESWLANGVDEVICVIDVTDTVCRDIAAEYPVRIIMTEVPGKRDALRKGWEAASTELIALVDSDTIWAPDVRVRVCEPFVDAKVGGVGTRQSVLKPRTLWQNAADMYLDYRYFDELAAQTVVGQAVSCLSGRTAVYRRLLLEDVSEEFMNETFLGIPCLSGDDKRLTSLTIKRGYKTCLQRNARVWSTFPAKFTGFRKQRLRWARNTWRSDLRAIGEGWAFRHPMLAFMMVDKMVSGFTLLSSLAFLILAVVLGHWLIALTLVCWWFLSRCAKLLPHLRNRPEELRIVPAFIMVSIVMAVIKIWALITIKEQRWLTRQVQVEHGEVVRSQGDS